MQVLWHKLQRVRIVLKQINYQPNAIRRNILKARQNLLSAQNDLQNNRFDRHKIEEIKKLTNDVIHWNQMEEKLLL